MGKIRQISVFLYILVLILMLSLVWYDNKVPRNVENISFLQNYLKNPEKYGGRQVENFGKIINSSNDHFYFYTDNAIILVYGSGVKKSKYGETVMFLDYKKNGIIEMVDYHHYKYNYVLYFTSVIAIGLCAVILFKEWKLTRRGFKSA